jgi:putative acetyltransferase
MNLNSLIRHETPGDIDIISQLVEAAFQSSHEAELVSLIRSRKQSLLSLVASLEGEIVGHVMLSPIEIDTTPTGDFAGLAPLSVVPRHQGKGIGGLLMRSAIDESKKLGFKALFLLGSPDYYPRFGFSPSHIGNEYGATDAFMHLELEQGSLRSIQGIAKYVSAFQEIGA